MVLFTDGKNEALPRETPQDPDTWDAEAVTMADRFKAQGVEVYVVGFFCPRCGSGQYCTSRLVDYLPSVCPGPWTLAVSTAASPIDILLKNISSSSAGTCDHYYPLAKSDDPDELAQLFTSLASRLMRVRLTT
jgi:hypothetical protein